jgi:S-adenosylmethionine:diacylglycerol 3-amino-3-carboxypropyl transferase
MTGNMVSLRARSPAVFPLARQAKVVRALATDVIAAQVVVKSLGVREELRAFHPLTWQARVLRSKRGRTGRRAGLVGRIGGGGHRRG